VDASESLHRREGDPRALRDPRLAALAWHDLVPLSRHAKLGELAHPLPWLAASLALAHHWHHLAALPCSFMFFLAALRLSHDCQHDNLRLGAPGADLVLLATSILMLGSNHTVRWNHLRHHRHMLGAGDIEGAVARLPAWRALLIGPRFIFRLNRAALAGGDARTRRWIVAELAGNVAWIAAVFLVLDLALDSTALRYHVLAMAAGQVFTAFFCVWSVHRDGHGHAYPARTLDGRFLNLASYNMFLHVEHHLFPRVPTRRLHVLARRLDAVAPDLRAARAL
jgi:fatty acid desaturase